MTKHIEGTEQKLITQIMREEGCGFFDACEMLDTIYERADVEDVVDGLLTRYRNWDDRDYLMEYGDRD